MPDVPRPRLLIADDHAAMRSLLRSVVAGITSDVLEAADGAEAVRLHAAGRPDWILMDIRMAPMDGLEAIRRILACDPGARIIAITQCDLAELGPVAMRAGAKACLAKDRLDLLLPFLSAPPTGRPPAIEEPVVL